MRKTTFLDSYHVIWDTTILMTTWRKSCLKGGSWPWDDHLSSLTWLNISTLRAFIRYLPSPMTPYKSSFINLPVSSCVLLFHPLLMQGILRQTWKISNSWTAQRNVLVGKKGKKGWKKGEKLWEKCCMLDWERNRLTKTHSGNIPYQETVEGCDLSQRPDYLQKFIKLRPACFRLFFS